MTTIERSPEASGPRHPARTAAWCGGYLALSAGAAWLSKTSLVPGGFSPWWPPAGLMLALFVLVGRRAFPLAVAGRLASIAVVFPAGLTHHLGATLLRAFGISAAYLVAGLVLRATRSDGEPLRAFTWFLCAGVLAGPLLADLVAAVVALGLDHETVAVAWDDARTFWVGDAVAVATITPLLVLLPRRWADLRTLFGGPPSGSLVEAVVQGVALVAVPLVILGSTHPGEGAAYLVLTVLPVVWVAIRHGEVPASLGVVVLNVTISVGAAAHFGPSTALLQIQVVMLAAAVTAASIRAAIRAQQLATAERAASEARYRSLVAHLPDHVLRLTMEGSVLLSSVDADAHGTQGMIESGDLIAHELVVSHDLELRRVLRTGEPEFFAWEVGAGGGRRWLTTRLVPEPIGHTVLAVTTDVTMQRVAEHRLDQERRTDILTGLANRTGVLDELGARLGALPTSSGVVGVVALDVDQFKLLNSSLGHDEGDEVLRHVAGVVARSAGAGAGSARLDADEFAVVLGPGFRPEAVVAAADALVAGLRNPLRLASGEVFPTASVGLVWTTDPHARPVELLQRAIAAVHAAKDLGGDRRVVFQESQLQSAAERHETREVVRRALAHDGLVVLYQPVVDMETGEILGAEALVRIRADDGSLVEPASFIPVAELYGLDVALGAVVLQAAVGQLAAWRAEGWEPQVLGVNVTSRQLCEPTFAAELGRICGEAAVSPSVLSLELTETTAVSDVVATAATIDAVRSLGARCALDDFGTGYASIAYLGRLPVDTVKIDESFVARLPGDDDDQTIVGLVVGVARQLGCDLVAEGVETVAQRDVLLRLGCRSGQGYLFARPMFPDELLELVREGRVLGASG